MKWSMFSEAAEKFFEYSDAMPFGPEVAGETREFANKIKSGQRFYLPRTEHFMERKHYADFMDVFRLPYETTVLLTETTFVPTGEQIPLLIVARDPVGVLNSAWDVKEQGEPFAIVSSCVRIEGTWFFQSAVVFSKSDCGAVYTSPLRTPYMRHVLGDRINDDESIDRIAAEFQPELTALTSLLALLAVDNVKREPVKAPVFVNRKRAKKGRLPLFDYHVLRVDGERWDGELRGGVSSGFRSHLRRGHIRRLQDGRRVFVRAAFVHGKVDGFVSKDYEVA